MIARSGAPQGSEGQLPDFRRRHPMKKATSQWLLAVVLVAAFPAAAQKDSKNPIWWEKYQYLLHNGPDAGGGPTTSLSVGTNVDVSNECGPQSETFITLD